MTFNVVSIIFLTCSSGLKNSAEILRKYEKVTVRFEIRKTEKRPPGNRLKLFVPKFGVFNLFLSAVSPIQKKTGDLKKT